MIGPSDASCAIRRRDLPGAACGRGIRMTGIVTVTLAPAIDLTYQADAVVPGGVNRASAWTRELSGKGVNVSHAVALSGTCTVAVLPMGEADAREAEARWLRPVAARERTRVNVTMATADGVTTKLNAPTSPLSPGEVEAVLGETVSQVRAIGAEWIVLAGVGATARRGWR